MAELKPCDCGCKYIVIHNCSHGYFCECVRCGKSGGYYTRIDNARKAWNKMMSLTPGTTGVEL